MMSNDNPAEDAADQPSYQEQIDELFEETEGLSIPVGSLINAILQELALLKAYHRTIGHEVAVLRATLEERELEDVLDEVNERLHENDQKAMLNHLKRLKNLSESYERTRADDWEV